VKVLSGQVGLELQSGPRLELRRGSEVRVDGRPALLDGDLLVASSGERPLTVQAGGSLVTVAGSARLSRDLAVSAASYRGGLRIQSAGRSLKVPALRQADIPSLGVVPPEPEPLDYDPRDEWDRRFLGDAIELGDELEAKSEGFTSSLRSTEGQTPGYFRLLVPALENEPSFGPPLLTERRPPGETLVGATIVVAGGKGSFVARWREVFAFRDQGAAWGLVALEQNVRDSGGLVRSLDAAIGRAVFAFAPVTTSRSPGTVPPPTSAANTGAGTGSAAGGGAAGGTAGTGGPGGAKPAPGGGSGSPPTTLPAPPLPTLPPSPTDPRPPPTTPPPTAPLKPLVDTITGLLP